MGAADYNPGRRWCQWWKMRIRMIRMKRIMGGVKRMSETKESPTHPGSAPATKLRRPRAPLQASWVQSRQVPCHYIRDWACTLTKRAVKSKAPSLQPEYLLTVLEYSTHCPQRRLHHHHYDHHHEQHYFRRISAKQALEHTYLLGVKPVPPPAC